MGPVVKKNVSIGPTTVVGWLTSLLLALPPAINQIVALFENEKARLSGPEKWLAILGIASLAITLVGRYLQSLQVPAVVEPPPGGGTERR
jgi:hypothetical protein